MSADPSRSDDRDHAGDVLEQLVVECLAGIEEEGDAAIETLCRKHPEQADALRAEIDTLRSIGLIGHGRGSATNSFPEYLGEFRLIERLGGGGMGVVYVAEQAPLGRRVALKLVRPELLYFPGQRERFRREVEAVARMQHPGIVPVYTVGEQGGIPYFAMELIEGCTLLEVLGALHGKDPSKLSGRDLAEAIARAIGAGSSNERPTSGVFDGSWLDSCLHIARQVADALEHAHGRGVIHRDVKPSNIAVTPSGRAMLLDFGLASREGIEHLTKSGSQPGSLPYMSPEQLRGERALDGRTDVYSLGVTLYELLTLQRPFDADSSEEMRSRILAGAQHRIREFNRAVPWDAQTVCMAAMELEAGRRYATAGDLARDLGNVLARRPIEARRPGAWLTLVRWTQRHPAASAGIAMGFILILGLGVQQRLAMDKLEAQMKSTAIERDLAKEVADFMVGLIHVSDPSEARGREVTVREILDRGSQRIDTELRDQPLVQARLMDIMGSVYKNLGLHDRATELLQGALAIRRRELGDKSEEVAHTLNSLGGLMQVRRDLEAAETFYREALQIMREIYPQGHPSVAISLCNLADALREKQEFEPADAALREALEMRRKFLGETSVEVAATERSLGHLCLERGDLDSAEKLLRQCLSVFEALGIEDHPEVALAVDHLALLARHRGNGAAAEPLYQRALAMDLKLYGENHLFTSWALEGLGELAIEQQDCPSAIAAYQRVLAIRKIVLEPCDPLAVRAALALGNCLARLERYEESESMLLECLAVCPLEAGAKQPGAVQLRKQLVALYLSWGKPDKAAQYRALDGGTRRR